MNYLILLIVIIVIILILYQCFSQHSLEKFGILKKNDEIFLSRDNTVLLLIDHQVGLYTGIRDIPVEELKHNVVSFIKALKLFNIPIIITANAPTTLWGPVIPEITSIVPNVKIINRTTINAMDDSNVMHAIHKTGRKELIIGGVSLEVCATFAALAAKKGGYFPRVILDICGTFDDAGRLVGVNRLLANNIPMLNYFSAAAELLEDNSDPLAAKVYDALDMSFATLVTDLKGSKAMR
jgi:isochorismate hydrolase